MQRFPTDDSNFLVPLACHVQTAVCNKFIKSRKNLVVEVQGNPSLLCQNSSSGPVIMLLQLFKVVLLLLFALM